MPRPDSRKQLACPSKDSGSSLPSTAARKFSTNSSVAKWATDPALEVGMSLVAEDEDPLVGDRPQGVLVDRDPAHRVAQLGADEEGCARVRRDRDEQVEGEGPPVVGVEGGGLVVDALDGEVRCDPDAPVLEEVAEGRRGDGLGEGTVERGDEGDVDEVPDAALAEVVLDEEGELQGCHGALDRHLADVDEEPAALEALERVVQRLRALQGVELVDPVPPQRAVGHAGHEVGSGLGAGGDDEPVVAQGASVGEVDGAFLGSHPGDLGVDDVDAVVDLGPAGLDHPLGVHPEGDEEVPGLVVPIPLGVWVL